MSLACVVFAWHGTRLLFINEKVSLHHLPALSLRDTAPDPIVSSLVSALSSNISGELSQAEANRLEALPRPALYARHTTDHTRGSNNTTPILYARHN